MADLLPTDEPTLPLLLDVSILDDNGSLGSSESPSHLDLVNVNFAHRGLKELPDHLDLTQTKVLCLRRNKIRSCKVGIMGNEIIERILLRLRHNTLV